MGPLLYYSFNTCDMETSVCELSDHDDIKLMYASLEFTEIMVSKNETQIFH